MKKPQIIIYIFIIFIFIGVGCSKTDPKDNISENNTSKELATEITNNINNIEKIDMYAGPGTDYVKRTQIYIDKNIKIIREEGRWFEVQYLNYRGYIEKQLLQNVDLSKVQMIVNKISSNVYDRPTIYQLNTEYNLTNDIDLYYSPDSTNSYKSVSKDSSVKIINMDIQKNLVQYIQVEVLTKNGKERAYVTDRDLFDYNNPIKNFDEVKNTNAKITYNDIDFYSTTGAYMKECLNNWQLDKSFNVHESNWNVLGGITSLIGSNDNNIDLKAKIALPELSAGKKNYYSTYQTIDTARPNLTKTIEGYSVLIESIPNFLKGAYSSINLNIQLQSYKGEHKIVIRVGEPIEAHKYAGQTLGLDQLLINYYGNGVILESQDLQDKMIREIFPNLNGDKKYSMKCTFSDNYSDNPYGYYIIIDKNLKVFTNPIIHNGTTFNIYYNGTVIMDAAPIIGSYISEIDSDSAQKILALLESNGFVFEGRQNVLKNEKSPFEQEHWVIFKEGYRNGRIELSTVDSDIKENLNIIWNKGLTLNNTSGMSKCNQYYLNEKGEWEKIGDYHKLTDYALEVIASNLDIYDNTGKLILEKTDYSTIDLEKLK